MSELSVYVHFPWCLQKCPYCDFASSGIDRKRIPHGGYADAVLRELEGRAASLGTQRLKSIFFGGGTPSLWEAGELKRVLDAIVAAFPNGASEAEVTVECNPTSLEQHHAAALYGAGVNRLSVGVQSLDHKQLRFLGRLHDDKLAISALKGAMQEVPRVSADLMFGMPGQTPAAFLSEVAQLTDLGLRHLSVYALTIEPETQFGALHRKGRLALAKESAFADTYEATEAALAERGFRHYEVSNYAVPGQESVHNLHYWQAGSYLGLGAGAVGCMRGAAGGARRYRNQPNPERYMESAGSDAREVSAEGLDACDTLREGLMLGLRTAEGIDVNALSTLAGRRLEQDREKAIAHQHSLGNLVHEGGRLRVPQTRWLHLDGIVADLF